MLAAGRGTRRCRFVGGCGILELPYCVCACVRAHSARWVRVCVCACALSPMGICTLLDKSACIAKEIRISLSEPALGTFQSRPFSDLQSTMGKKDSKNSQTRYGLGPPEKQSTGGPIYSALEL